MPEPYMEDAALRSHLDEVDEFEARWNGMIDRLRVTSGVDQRNIAIAVTAGEDAFLRVRRAIATPRRLVAGGIGHPGEAA